MLTPSPVEMTVPIGISASASYAEKKDAGADTLPSLAIAATPLAGLKVGGKYRVELKNVLGEFPGIIWWWEWGTKEEILKARREEGEKAPMRVEILDVFSEKFLSVKMEEGPILEIVE